MNFLLVYRTAPHTSSGVAPCVLFLKRDMRTRLHLLRPEVKDYVTTQQASQKAHHDQHSRARELCVGQRVLVRNYRPGENWIPGTVVDRRGPLSYTVRIADGQLLHRHIDQLKERKIAHRKMFRRTHQILTLMLMKVVRQRPIHLNPS